jgi:hypothetical protein
MTLKTILLEYEFNNDINLFEQELLDDGYAQYLVEGITSDIKNLFGNLKKKKNEIGSFELKSKSDIKAALKKVGSIVVKPAEKTFDAAFGIVDQIKDYDSSAAKATGVVGAGASLGSLIIGAPTITALASSVGISGGFALILGLIVGLATMFGMTKLVSMVSSMIEKAHKKRMKKLVG